MGNDLFWFILIIPVALIVGYFFYKKKRDGTKGVGGRNNAGNNAMQNAAQKDEVWQTIKKKLKSDGEVGQEIIDSYVQRRNSKFFKKRDVYVVLFTTRDSKTLKENPPRALEVEVKTIKISRKENQRKILINGYKNYDAEYAWISKIREKETKQSAKQIAKREKEQLKNQKHWKNQKEKQEIKKAKKLAKIQGKK